MKIFIDVIFLLFLFILLGFTADLAVNGIKYMGNVLRMRLYAFGILLGIITSLPEFFLGINATFENAAGLSVGNVFGGVIVMLGLILGVSLILNRNIHTDGDLKEVIPVSSVIFIPVLFGLDGKFGLIDGLIMIGLYSGVIYYLYRINRLKNHEQVEKVERKYVGKAMIRSILGIIGILIASHFIVDITLDLMEYLSVGKLAVGLVVFAIGTNLPEISVALTSWRKKSAELSLSHLLSSSITNILILGILAFLKPIYLNINWSYGLMAIFLGVILVLFTMFYHSDKKMDQREGLILLGVYILFIINMVFIS